jgi:hypothetical protein
VTDVKAVPHAETIRMVNDYADLTVALIGGERKQDDHQTTVTACENRRGEFSETVYYVFLNIQVLLPEEQHLAALQRMRERWRQVSYTIKSDRPLSGGTRGEIIVQNPADEFEIAVTSTVPPAGFAVSVESPCLQSDEPI